MADIRRLELNYPRDCRGAFEDLCTLLFCMDLGLPHGVNRRTNQSGIESDPVEVGGRTYAYQAKYYEAPLGTHKEELKGCVEVARQKGVTDLFLFVSQDLTEDSRTKGDPTYLREIEATAEGGGGEPEVRLHWWTRSKIETTLDMEAYAHVRRSFLGDGGGSRVAAYYDHECGQFRDDVGSELYGRIPLRECYIEPVAEFGGGVASVRDHIESWVDDAGGAPIAVICGEPGHGKTSLCRKAVYDFRTSGWLAGRVSNVLRFSLNPARTAALDGGEFDLYPLLSWGDNRRSAKHALDGDDCRGALVFLDGFDELYEWRPGFDLEGFIKHHVEGFQRATGARVVVTSRSIAVATGATSYEVRVGGRLTTVPILRMLPVPRERQIGWIEECADYYRRLAAGDSDDATRGSVECAERATGELEAYLDDYRRLHEDDDLQAILGIPIILRMVVAARYVPREGSSIASMYDDLFVETWERRRHKSRGPSMAEAKAQLSGHALRVYLGDGDTAAVDDVPSSAWWLFSFYMTHGERRRVGFLHRSFYQFFLAREVLSWFDEYAAKGDGDAFASRLSCLARGRLDGSTLGYIEEIAKAEGERELANDPFAQALRTLRGTDGFLAMPSDGDARSLGAIAPIERANLVFWNVVSICGACGRAIDGESVNPAALRLFELSGCRMIGADIQGAHLSGARLSGADLSRARLSRADLTVARLSRANLSGADLSHADLPGADLTGAYLSGADLTLTGADLSHADLSRADLPGANLSGADLSVAHLTEARLSRADLSGARLPGADLSGARLPGADLSRADLSGARLPGADLSGTRLPGADLSHADLPGARLSHADLSHADLPGANLSGADLSHADLPGADLSGANLSGADLSGARLPWARLSGADLSGARLSRAYLPGADLSGARLSRANLTWARLSGADLSGADLSGADLTGTDLT